MATLAQCLIRRGLCYVQFLFVSVAYCISLTLSMLQTTIVTRAIYSLAAQGDLSRPRHVLVFDVNI